MRPRASALRARRRRSGFWHGSPNGASNTPLRDLSLRFRIVDPSGERPVFETRLSSLGYLAIGGGTSTSIAWASGAEELGTFTVSVEAYEGTEVVASAGAAFEMNAASVIRLLSGGLSLASAAVPSGSDVVATYTIDNEGVLDVSAGTVRVELFDAGALVASAEASLSVAGRDTAAGRAPHRYYRARSRGVHCRALRG